ncbi:MAG: 23S rRNA (uracil(1939)-C(5))-methyltransferase RlmD [Erysipelotrichaceae bacterium]|nr:23S rRNA (uracil(1939)-C(5))-methyltransferase RlmD [Erysipelotrichaceae bacterium]
MKFTVKKTGINGEGIAYFHKKPVFIKGALPEEEVLTGELSDKGTYFTAPLLKVLQSSENRVRPVCPYAELCGGCELLHVSAKYQKQIKKQLLEEALEKYTDILADVEIQENPLPVRYRNSCKLPFIERKGRLYTGMYRPDSNHPVIIEDCLMHEEALEEVRKQILDILNKYGLHAYSKKDRMGMRGLHIRVMKKKAQVCLITGEEKLPEKAIEEISSLPSVVSFWQNINTSNGRDFFGKQMIHLGKNRYLQFQVRDLKMKLSPRSFYQLNTYQAVALYDKVLSHIEEGEYVAEAYCGIGVMSLMAAKKARKVIGFDIVNDAILNARSSALSNHLENVRFECGDSGEVLYDVQDEEITTLIVDPPRSGLDETMIDAILGSGIRKIIYVSCNPSTLAKNLAALKREYDVSSVEGIDIFTGTAHVESVTVLERKEERRKRK